VHAKNIENFKENYKKHYRKAKRRMDLKEAILEVRKIGKKLL